MNGTNSTELSLPADTATSSRRFKRGTASQRVMTAAVLLLIAGRGELEIERLADAAGCSTGAIHHHYGSKAGVLAVARYNEVIADLMAPKFVAESRHLWLLALQESVDAIIAYMWDNPLTSVIVQETIKDASVAAENERWLRVHVAALALHLGQAQAAGHLPADYDTEVLAAGLAGGMRQIMRMYIARTEAPALAIVRRETWNFVARQVAVEPTHIEATSASGTNA